MTTPPPDAWPEAGENGAGTALRTPRLDLFAWLAAAFGASAVGMPLTQVALAARAPLLIVRARMRGPEVTLVRAGSLLACVPTGPLLVLAVVVGGAAAQPWGALAAVAATLAAAALALLGRHASRLAAPDPRWTAAVVVAGMRVAAATLLSLSLNHFATRRALGPIAADVTDHTVGLLAVGLGDLLLSGVAAGLGVSALRSAVPLRLAPAVAAPRAPLDWAGILGDLGFEVTEMDGGVLARGRERGLAVAIDILQARQPQRLTVRVSTAAPALSTLVITARGDQDADVALSDPILARMIRVSGVTPARAAALLEDAHEPLFAVLHGHEDARVGGGDVAAVVDGEGGPLALTDLDRALGDATALARHLITRAATL